MSRLGRQQHVIGLPSLNEAREARRHSIVSGKVRLRAMRPVFWLWTLVILSGFSVVYWRISAGNLASQKSGVAARQRAVRMSLGPKLVPFVERVESWVFELAKGPADEVISSEADWDALARKPGVYLRLIMTKAKDSASIRRAAAVSLNDGFTSCFFVREGAADPTQGPKCETSANCDPGLLCNEWDVCSPVPRPYNMRLAYRAWRILSDDFTRSLQDASDDLQVRALERELDQVTRVDVPVAIEVLQRAKTVTIVLDEEPADLQKPVVVGPGEPLLTEEQRVQGQAHDARIGIWDTATGQQLVRWRGRAQSRLVSVGRRVELDPEVDAARTRQANSCFLATTLKGRLLVQGAEKSSRGASPEAGGSENPISVPTK